MGRATATVAKDRATATVAKDRATATVAKDRATATVAPVPAGRESDPGSDRESDPEPALVRGRPSRAYTPSRCPESY